MKKILYFDHFPNEAHRQLNSKFIRILMEEYQVDVYSVENYFSKESNIIYQKYPSWIFKVKSSFVNGIFLLLYLFFKVDYKSYDVVFIPTFETRSFFMARLLLPRIILEKTFLVHHYNIDSLQFRFDRLSFDSYKNLVRHIVFEDFFTQFLIRNYAVDGNRISVISHPLLSGKSGENFLCPKNTASALSASNSQQLIYQIIEAEKQNHILSESGTRLIVKTKLKSDVASVETIDRFLSKDEYDDIIAKSAVLAMFHPHEFVYRESGYLIDGLTNKKIVVGFDSCKIIKQYADLYPHVCFAVSTPDEFLSTITSVVYTKASNEEFARFRMNHSDDIIKKQFKSIFTK